MNKKIQVWLNTHVWPFTKISDLEQSIDEAKHRQNVAEKDLEYIAAAFGVNIKVVLANMPSSAPFRPVQIFTGARAKIADVKTHGCNNDTTRLTEMVILEPKLISDITTFDQYTLMSERARQAASEIIIDKVAYAVVDAVREELAEIGIEHSTDVVYDSGYNYRSRY